MKESRRRTPRPPAAAAAASEKGNGVNSVSNSAALSKVRASKAKKGGGWCWGGASYAIIIALALFLFSYLYREMLFGTPVLRPRVITPLPVARVTDLEQFQGEHRERLFWGTYRPHLYFGIRSRTPKSLLAGLMWIGTTDGSYALRHTCEEGDKLSRYGWLRHDGATYGRQELLDQGLLVSTSFLKSKDEGSGYGGDWAVRIRAEDAAGLNRTTEDMRPQSRLGSVFFYIAAEGGLSLKLWPEGANKEDGPFAGGVADEIGKWQIYAKYKEGLTMNYVGFRHLQMHGLAKSMWSVLETQAKTRRVIQLPDSAEANSNVAVIQLTGTLPFELDIVFVSGVHERSSQVKDRVGSLMGAALGKRLVEKELEFEDRFEETFKLQDKVESERELEVGKVALSNMVGGIGYFYGQSKIAIPPKFVDPHSDGPNHWLYWPAALYSAVPSRSFFPRGFLWDEGFHQLVVSKWDRNISLDIIGHWLDLMNVDGWIPREQILGSEARDKVGEEWHNQYTSNANPPALMLVLKRLALDFKSDERKGQSKKEDLQYFKTIYPRLEAWFDWFNTTQAGKEPGTYYWHGRDSITNRELNPKTLSSGLDDYPRSSHPSDDDRHVDLWCWMALAAETMTMIAGIAGEPPGKYEATARSLTNLTRLNEMHFDYDSGRYYDYGNHTEKVKLRWQEVQDPNTGFVQRILRRAVLQQPKLTFVPHFGYVSFFPFAMQVIPHDSPIIGHHLEMLHNYQLLWTDYGLRSLATDSSIYMKRNTEHDAPYWRGPIWISMNYLILSALHDYATVDGPYRKTAAIIYPQLRQNLIKNIVDKYYESGYLWENYNNKAKGKGQGSHPFTGWTSLVLLMMGEIY
ncbi:unnamed protein product [Calypogeia fissa]